MKAEKEEIENAANAKENVENEIENVEHEIENVEHEKMKNSCGKKKLTQM